MQTSPVRLGALISLATLAVAGVLGLIAVLDTDNVAASLGTGFGIAFIVFLSGATLACALACLARGRLEWVALGSIASPVWLSTLSCSRSGRESTARPTPESLRSPRSGASSP